MLELRNLCMHFENAKHATLKNINLQIQEGSFTCIVGASGCGKSTLLNLIAGLTLPSSGSILLDGQPISGPGRDRVMMFQESALFPWLTVLENVCFGMDINGMPKAKQLEIAEHYLSMVHLSRFKDYRVHELSGGMKQRAALARALCMDSKILLMDEPFSALDKQTTNLLREELAQIWQQTKKTIILITHSVEEAVFFADRVLFLSEETANIAGEYVIDLPRPRHIESPEFIRYRQDILHQVRNEVEKIEHAEEMAG
ncbi:MAG: ABC transporter ATP-binding protein [Bacillota bacterium]|nr:ABC transporter ATP-binding protein [Bacillota bacterium]